MPKDGEPFLKYLLVICVSAETLGLDPQWLLVYPAPFYFRSLCSRRIHYTLILNNPVA